MKEAFIAGREDAAYEHGHGGYTGTLAEKDSYWEFKIPGVDGKTLIEWLDQYVQAKYRYEDEPPAGTRPDGLPITPPLPWAGHEVALEKAWQIYDDKWGPAVGIQLTDNIYHFCGYASC